MKESGSSQCIPRVIDKVKMFLSGHSAVYDIHVAVGFKYLKLCGNDDAPG